MADDVVQFGKAFQGERRVPGIADWPMPAVGGCASKKAADNHDDRIAAAQASEGDHLVAVRTGNGERMIGAMSKESGQLAAQLQQRPREGKFDASVRPAFGKRRPIDRHGEGRQCRRTRGKVDWPSVVRIDQRQIPKLRALIEIRNTGHHCFQRNLREAVQRAEQGHALRELVEGVDERSGAVPIEQPVEKILESVLICFIGGDPAGLLLAFACSLDRVVTHPLQEACVDAGERPGAKQRLIEHVFVCRRGHLHRTGGGHVRGLIRSPARK